MRLARRHLWWGVCLAVAVLALALVWRSDVGGEPDDNGRVVNLGHVCGKNQPEVVLTPPAGQSSVRVNCLGGGQPSP